MPAVTVSDLSKRLISQHRRLDASKGKPGSEKLLDEILDVIQTSLADPIFAIHTQRIIDTATGIWLDYIGARLGLLRATTLFPDIEYFGFNRVRHVGFGQGPFFTDILALQERLGVSDSAYPVSYTHLRAHETKANLV